MRLSELLRGVQVEERIGPIAAARKGRARSQRPERKDRQDREVALDQIEIREVRDNSREVGPGDLFIALPGQTVDGHDFLADAAARGAVAALVERAVPGVELVQLRVGSAALALAQVAANRHGRPADHLLLCAITGTNGKTTTNFLVEALLRHAGHEPGMMGTVVYRYKGKTLPAPLTTPAPLELHRTLGEMRAEGVSAVTLEASSHALALGRLSGLRFRAAAFTNLTQDHLDFHGDMEEYYKAKARLFRDHLLPASEGGTGVINLDGPYGQRMAAEVKGARLLTVSIEGPADVQVDSERLSISRDGISATLRTPVGEVVLHSPLIGRYNLANLAVAAGIGVALGLPAEIIGNGLSSLAGVSGRVQRVGREKGRGPTVFVDYAHSPDALERVIAALRPLLSQDRQDRQDGREGPADRLLVVFGCGGDRDRGKRPQMGRLAARDADLVVVTSDNPRTEDPAAIIGMIVGGITAGAGTVPLLERAELATAGKGYLVEPDRRQAIRAAVLAARPGDVVLIAGKGHEDYQIVGTTKHHFDDREEAQIALQMRAEPAEGSPAGTPSPRAPSGPAAAAPAPSAPPNASIDLPIERVLAATHGQLLRGGARKFTQVVIDGRAAAPGALFVAIRGERHDGHDFAAQAVLGGATGVLCERGRGGELAGLLQETTVIEVPDTIVALGQLGRAHREAPEIARNLRVAAITGSTGKTTTKDMLAAILEAHARGEVLKTEGNLNNHLGVPLTLLRLRAGHRFAVIEMGMSARGEIAYLTSLARPDVGVLTNVAPVHLETLGTLEQVALAKGELWVGLLDSAAAVYPVGPEHALLAAQARLAGVLSGRLRGWPVAIGPEAPGQAAAVRAELVSEDPEGLRLRLSISPGNPGTLGAGGPAGAVRPEAPAQDAATAAAEASPSPEAPESIDVIEVNVPLLGAHHAGNAALAAAAALALDVPPAAIAAGLARVSPGKHRGQLVHIGGRHVIDDCYNASPTAVVAALGMLARLRGAGRAHVVLGDMLELGREEVALHEQVGEAAADSRVDLLITLGPRAAHAAEAASRRGVSAVAVDSPEAAVRLLGQRSSEGDWILVKGSRGMRLERVLEQLESHFHAGQVPEGKQG